MSKKVLHIFGQMERGGAELRTLATMKSLQSQHIHCEYCVLSGLSGVLDDEIRQQGSEVHYCKLGFLFPYYFIRLLRKEKVDVVHSHVAMVSGFILLLAWIAGVDKRIAHFRNTHDTGKSSSIRKIRNKFLHKLIDVFATDILGVCEGALAIFWEKSWRDDSRCKAIYNGLPKVELHAKNPNFWNQWQPAIDAPVFINIARMAPQKNHLFMLDVIASYRQQFGNCYLVFIGKEQDQIKADVIQKVRKLELQEQIIYAEEQSSVYDFINNADAMLFPSLWEGLPGAVIEAASTGLPVVASDLPGTSEISIFLTSVSTLPLNNNSDEWAQALNQATQLSIQERKNLASNFDSSPFSLENCVKALYDVYK